MNLRVISIKLHFFWFGEFSRTLHDFVMNIEKSRLKVKKVY